MNKKLVSMMVAGLLVLSQPAMMGAARASQEVTPAAEETSQAPETQAPETQAPETQAPETQAPETEAPETQAPETEAPETEAPETQAPETEASETEAPETEAPETEAPETEAPETQAPETQAPETEAPETQAPETEAPETQAPATEAPATQAPATEAPATEEPAKPAQLKVAHLFWQANARKARPGESVTLSLDLAVSNQDGPLDDFYIAVLVSDVAVEQVSYGGAELHEAGKNGRVLLYVRDAYCQDGRVYSQDKDLLHLTLRVVPFAADDQETSSIAVQLLNAAMGDMTPENRGAGNARVQTGLHFELLTDEAADEAQSDEKAEEKAEEKANEKPEEKVEEKADEQPEEKADEKEKEQPEEKADQEKAEQEGNIIEETEPKDEKNATDEQAEEAQQERSARIETSAPVDQVEPGETLRLTAVLSGFDGMDVYVQWQEDDGQGYQDIEGAVGDTLELTADAQHAGHAYRFVIKSAEQGEEQ